MFRRVVSTFLACVVVACTPLVAVAGDTVAEDAHQRLSFVDGQPGIGQWLVRAGEDGQWRSLLSPPEQTRASTGQLRVHVPGLERGDWRVAETEDDTLSLNATAQSGGIRVSQRVELLGEPHRLQLKITFENPSNRPWRADGPVELRLGPGLGETPARGLGIAESLYSFVRPIAWDGDDVHLPEAAQSPTLAESLEWTGLYSRYFALLVKPTDPASIGGVSFVQPDSAAASLPPRYLPEALIDLGIDELAAGERAERDFLVFAGPRSRQAVSGDGTDFSRVLFPGLWDWMRQLCFALLWLLEAIYLVVPDWGLAIITLAVLVRLAMYPLATRVLASQQEFVAAQRQIQPEIKRIKQQYRGGEQSERILQLYESHGVSPLAGLKPLLIVLIQIPVFIALFHVLGEAFELRDASFLWIETLAEPDRLFGLGGNWPLIGEHFNLLPVLLAATTLATLKLSPAPAMDAKAQHRQNIFLVAMAFGFLLLFYPFPSGMVLYWTAANALHILQSRWAMRRSGSGDQAG
ncbi:YidC/Oxa1 family membrane protein insertase [Wenzhouxiangella sp. EGI_FJ10305]|uniref:YidC/Oxa1 family membrane protein insertase n=1 Tax=Wenzhouxiangella sp. EGI_FJ10305 TaxID=3243768 RepID=UPI0035DF97DC